jgi:hypothetical protein
VYTILIFICSLSQSLLAQQEALRMMYPMMPLGINPAKAGTSKVASVSGFYRKKPLFSVPGLTSLSQQYLSFDMPIQDESWGIGFLGFNSSQAFADGTGVISSNLGIAGVASKHFLFGEDQQVSIGANIGVNQKPVITANGNTVLKGSYGLGFLYQYKNLQVGISRPSAYMESGLATTAPIYGQAEVLLDLSSGDKVRLGSVVRHLNANGISDTKIDLYGVYWLNEVVGIGAWYLTTGAEMGNAALLGSAQVALGRNFMVSYAYDFLGKSITSSSLSSSSLSSNDSSSGFHQIGIRYEIDLGNGKINRFRP